MRKNLIILFLILFSCQENKIRKSNETSTEDRQETNRDSLQLKEGSYSNSFQSRLLKDPWLKPYTDFELERLPKEGVKKLAVITPAFVADCLETLEEIAMEGKQEFLKAGGEQYKHVPCLNDNDDWVDVMVKWTKNW